MKCAALIKPRTGETYLWLWDGTEASRLALVQRLGVMAADPELSMTFMDADTVLKRVLELEKRNENNANHATAE